MKIKISSSNWKVIAATIKAGGKQDSYRTIPVTIESDGGRRWVWATNSYTLAAAPLEGPAVEPFQAAIDPSFFMTLGKLFTPRGKGVGLEIDLDECTISAAVPWPEETSPTSITVTSKLLEKPPIEDWCSLLPTDADPSLLAETWLTPEFAALGPAFFGVTDPLHPVRTLGGGKLKQAAWQGRSGATWLIMPVRMPD